jgi:hypothetical protein
MGIMDKIFGNNQQQAAPAAPANQQQQATGPAGMPAGYNATTPASATSDANGMIPPAAANEGGTSTDAASPLDEFKDLWQNVANSDTSEETGVLGTIDPKQIMAAAGKVNFAKVITAEDIAAIQAGGEGATAALGRALNSTSQAVYAQSALASSKLIEQAVSKIEERILGKLPDQVRRNLLDNSMVEDNASYSHPAAAPLVQLVQNQLATKHPNATPSQLKKMAQDYFANSFKAINGDKASDTGNTSTKDKKGDVEIDWATELDLF